MNKVQKTEWGKRRGYKTDDADVSENELEILQGGNGDWYVSIRYIAPSGYWATETVRVTTSGQVIDGFDVAISQAYRALGGERISHALENDELARLRRFTEEIGELLGVDLAKYPEQSRERMLRVCRSIILNESAELEDFRCKWCAGPVKRFVPSQVIGHARLGAATICGDRRRNDGHEVPEHGHLTAADLEPIP